MQNNINIIPLVIDDNFVNKSYHAIRSESGILNIGRKFFRNSLLSLFSLLNKKLEDKFLRCLYLHHVFDDQIEKFEQLFLNLKELGHFIDTDTMMEMLEGKKEIDGRYFHLSFDDGFKNNFTNAVPILSKYEIPCIFFVPTDFIGASWEKTKYYCIETTRHANVIEMLTWEELRDMTSLGFEIGSHTRSHTQLSSISHDEDLLKNELLFSKEEIEKKIQIECKYIAWPFGRHNDIDAASLSMIQTVGYNACFGAFRGTVFQKMTNTFEIPRHEMDLQLSFLQNEYFAKGNMEMEFKI